MTESYRFLIDAVPAGAVDPGRDRLRQVDGDGTAWWALDISKAHALIAAADDGARPVDWASALLAAVRIADADQNAMHALGPIGARWRMLGQPVTAYWPSEGWRDLAELVVAAVAGRMASRRISTSLFDDATLTVSGNPARPDMLVASLGGCPADDRSFWSVRASEQRYRSLIHHLPWALLQVDATAMAPIFEALRCRGVTDIGAFLATAPEVALESRDIVRVTDANLKALQVLGVASVDQVIGPVDFVFAASPETAKRVIKAHFDGERSYTEVMKLRTFDGRLRDVELTVTYPTPPERLDVSMLSLDDITDRLRTEVQYRQLQADYSRAARISMLGELATSIAHEVNQPLAAIVTNAETSLRWLARDDPNLAKVMQLTARIAESARHASDIVKRVRAMAAPRAPEREPLELNIVVFEALVFVRHELESRAIDLAMRLGSGLPNIFGDRVQLQQVIVNLILNAVQAVGKKGRIDLSTALDPAGGVAFAIHDSGPGIAPEHLDRIFSSFFTTKDEGMGIGLAICQSIITAHGGAIGAANHPDGGARFRFVLPVA
ncbi:signal transduction histidine kinase [Sphingomonas zeicaulis]|uniref:sensor histidine kinase n=1 Tax=Sphingomonas zeicaulis TaxID=1632740 RepID=UPI003D24EF18